MRKIVDKYNTKSTLYVKNNSNGITLITLVVTIIVLLILSGVTIANITGGESTVDKAGQAKNENEIQQELEELQTLIDQSAIKGIRHGNFSGSADASSIKAALKNKKLIQENPDEVIDESKTEWIVTGVKTGTKYAIESNGKVTRVFNSTQ